ncbi:zinc finger protein 512B [Lates japonicus]|uniref:Zinc finger protein 512B n=1 Tax=Lates japonicus TaxID=270547 RepID=A0AAD3M254_LATJO|nr:zinc finger protein 512B [Lates japonicus]
MRDCGLGALPKSRDRLCMTKVEEKLKAGRAKRQEGSGFSEEPQRRSTPSQSSKKDPATTTSAQDALKCQQPPKQFKRPHHAVISGLGWGLAVMPSPRGSGDWTGCDSREKGYCEFSNR